MLITTKDKYIKYLSPSCYGKKHDYGFNLCRTMELLSR